MNKKVAIALILAGFAVAGLSGQKLTVGTIEASKAFKPLIESVFQEAGLTAEVVAFPMARVNQNLADSTLAAAFFVSDTALQGMPGTVKVPVPLFTNEVVAVSIKPGLIIKSAADLSQYSVGIVRGSQDQVSLTKGMTPVVAPDISTQFQMLKNGRFDVALVARAGVAPLAKAAGITTFTVHEPAVLVIPLYLALSPKNAGLEAKLTAAFKKAVDSGKWAKDLKTILASAP